MAKLNARGREEWLRMEHTETFQSTIDPEPRMLTVRTQRAYMSDGHVLVRNTYLKPDGKVDWDDGWKDWARQKRGFDIDAVRAALTAKGWTEVKPK